MFDDSHSAPESSFQRLGDVRSPGRGVVLGGGCVSNDEAPRGSFSPSFGQQGSFCPDGWGKGFTAGSYQRFAAVLPVADDTSSAPNRQPGPGNHQTSTVLVQQVQGGSRPDPPSHPGHCLWNESACHQDSSLSMYRKVNCCDIPQSGMTGLLRHRGATGHRYAACSATTWPL